MGTLDNFYANLPTIAQHISVSVYGLYWRWLRFGPGYSQFLRGYLERESFQPQDWTHWQNQRLLDVIKGALSTPYYAQTWTKSQKDSALAGLLQDLPLLEKEPLRTNPQAFLRTDMDPWIRFTFYTSGSTGTPIATIWTIPEVRSSLAIREARSALWAKVSFTFPRGNCSDPLHQSWEAVRDKR